MNKYIIGAISGLVLAFAGTALAASTPVPWYSLTSSAASITNISKVYKITDNSAGTTCYVLTTLYGDGQGISCVK